MSPTLMVETDPIEVPQESVDGVETDDADTSVTEDEADDERSSWRCWRPKLLWDSGGDKIDKFSTLFMVLRRWRGTFWIDPIVGVEAESSELLQSGPEPLRWRPKPLGTRSDPDLLRRRSVRGSSSAEIVF